MSIQRQFKRARIKALPTDERPVARAQPVRFHGTGYSYLHPRKGWKRHSFKRVAAQRAMALHGFG